MDDLRISIADDLLDEGDHLRDVLGDACQTVTRQHLKHKDTDSGVGGRSDMDVLIHCRYPLKALLQGHPHSWWILGQTREMNRASIVLLTGCSTCYMLC